MIYFTADKNGHHPFSKSLVIGMTVVKLIYEPHCPLKIFKHFSYLLKNHFYLTVTTASTLKVQITNCVVITLNRVYLYLLLDEPTRSAKEGSNFRGDTRSPRSSFGVVRASMALFNRTFLFHWNAKSALSVAPSSVVALSLRVVLEI